MVMLRKHDSNIDRLMHLKKTSKDIIVAKALNEQLGNSNVIGETMYAIV